MKLPLYQVDAFTSSLFGGNPAAVVLCESFVDDSTMQHIAAENNLSETAFVVKKGIEFQIRWFTPATEVDLCGHATLAAAHVLFKHLDFSGNRVLFSSKSGPLSVRLDGEVLYLDFPTDSYSQADPPRALIDGLSNRPRELYKGRDDYLAVFDSETEILSLAPDMAAIMEVPSRGVIVSAPGKDFDFVSRFFGSGVGVAEDPVTGSAHTTLIPYWSKRLGKNKLSARQLSKRGGELICRDLGDRVEIGGNAVTYLIGEISV